MIDHILDALSRSEENVRRHEVPFGTSSTDLEERLRDYQSAMDDDGHHPDCECDDCEQIANELTFGPMDRRSPDEIARQHDADEAAFIEENERAGRAPSLVQLDAPISDELLAEMLRQQAALLGDDPTICRACGLPLPPREKRRGRPRRFHDECKEAAMKRQQRGADVKLEAEEKVPYVVPGYTGRARPSSEAARRIFRKSYERAVSVAENTPKGPPKKNKVDTPA